MPIHSNLPSLLFPLAATGLSLITIFLLDKFVHLSLPKFRYSSIDGLRGYLAFFVFLHHSYIWYGYIHTHEWVLPDSHLYRYFGTGSVMVFFMITAFLFFGRLLDAKKNKVAVDWVHLYISRVMRISPLFLFSTALAFFVSGYTYNWLFNSALQKVLTNLLYTLGMGLFEAPVLDSFVEHGLSAPIMAGVLWTLPYEWIFYLCLPAIALLLGSKSSKYIFLLPILAIWYLLRHDLNLVKAYPFLSGLLVAILVRTNIKNYLSGSISAILSLLLLVFSIVKFDDPLGFIPLAILTYFFCVVASGNSFFGILNLRVSRLLGEISYSIYLLHGITLFIFIRLVLGDSEATALSMNAYWLCIALCIPVLIAVCYFTFLRIEKPCINLSSIISKKLKLNLSRI
jgi:peptidoglycan/LPS O-acetylase OafA/YrhL